MTRTRRAPPSETVRKTAPTKTVWVVAAVYNDDDGFFALVSNAMWYNTEKEAKKRAEEWAHDLYDEWVYVETQHRTTTINGELASFDQVWEKVDNSNPKSMDWGFDPVEDWGVASVRIRVFKVYRGK